MASDTATRRLKKEYMTLNKKPIDNIVAMPLESNILEWHYVITGTKDSPYHGGHYHGKLRFPAEYPYKPPAVLMFTPSGRFKPNQRLCLSMSDFHPETWNPMWSVSSILTGLYSFMLENQATLGSVEASDAQRRKHASNSLEFNCKDKIFRELFPDLVDVYKERQAEQAEQLAKDLAAGIIPPAAEKAGRLGTLSGGGGGDPSEMSPLYFVGIAAVAVIFLAIVVNL